jgi:N-acetylglucosaminyldiphosphoundecaprenol N-acetyl-beta-D-mannosaminyltransferase
LGAADDILQRTISEFERLHPGIVIAGSQNGYFSSEQEEAVATAIRDSRADVLFVAITSPKKERFMAKWSALMNVPVVHGVGGSFDVVAGKVKRAPELWQKLGLEWLYRVKQEPGRLWKRYAVTNALFTWMLLKELMFGQHEGGKRQ